MERSANFLLKAIIHKKLHKGGLVISKNHLNTIGIALVALGSYLVWRYLGKVAFHSSKDVLKGIMRLTIPDITLDLVWNLRWSIRLSNLGIFLIIIGSLLQAASNYMPDTPG